MKRALVTGHAGFVGTHMVKALQAADYYVTGIDINDEPYSSYEPGAYLRSFAGDCREFFKDHNDRYDLVVHLAAVVGGREMIDGDPLSVATDLAIDSDMFNWAVRTGQERVVYYSSSAAYPISYQTRESHWDLPEEDIDLANIDNPDTSYGWSKLTGEMLAGYARKKGVAVHVLRPFSGYGSDQALDYPFPSFVKRAQEKQSPFQVWGDGEQVRDFIHIDDVVDATLEVVRRDIFHPLNLGTGRATSFNQLAGMMMEAAGYSADIEHLPAKPTGVHYRVADVELMNNVYTAKISLEEGIWRAMNGIV